jgi:hypothetical protein
MQCECKPPKYIFIYKCLQYHGGLNGATALQNTNIEKQQHNKLKNKNQHLKQPLNPKEKPVNNRRGNLNPQ